MRKLAQVFHYPVYMCTRAHIHTHTQVGYRNPSQTWSICLVCRHYIGIVCFNQGTAHKIPCETSRCNFL